MFPVVLGGGGGTAIGRGGGGGRGVTEFLDVIGGDSVTFGDNVIGDSGAAACSATFDLNLGTVDGGKRTSNETGLDTG